MNKKLILKTTGALMAASTSLGLAAPAAFAQEGDGVGTGNNVDADVDVPVTVCSIAVELLGGDAYTECYGTDEAAAEGTRDASDEPAGSVAASGDGVASGNAVDVDADVPVTACGVAAGVGGDAYADCEAAAQSATSSASDDAPPTASGDGVVTGNAADIDALAHLLLCGVAVGVAGDAEAYCGP